MSKNNTTTKEVVMKVVSIDLPRADDDPRVQEAHAALKAAKTRQDRSAEEYIAAAKALKVLSNKLQNRLDAESVSSEDMRRAKAAKASAEQRCQQANAAYDAALKAERNARKEVRAEIAKLAHDQYEAALDELAARVGPACSEFVGVADQLEQATRKAMGPDPSAAKFRGDLFRLDRPARDPKSGASGVARVAEWAKGRLGE